MTQETIKENIHPEGLTDTQEKLADLLIETKIQAKVRRRCKLPDGTYQFPEVIRNTSPIDFPQDPGEFVLKLHEHNPSAPLSPIYINLRNLPEEVLDHIGKVLAEIESQETPDFCAGIPNAGIPIAQAYSKFSGIELINIFDKVQEKSGRRIVAKEKSKKKRKSSFD